MARAGHERFTQPTVAAHRRYEALRAYYVEERSAAEIAERFAYTKASVQTLISQYREADVGELFQVSRPGPKRQPKKDAARERVIELRQQRHGIEEIVSEPAIEAMMESSDPRRMDACIHLRALRERASDLGRYAPVRCRHRMRYLGGLNAAPSCWSSLRAKSRTCCLVGLELAR